MNIIIDGSSLLWRSYHVNKENDSTAVVYGFINMLKNYVAHYKSNTPNISVYIAWDKKISNKLNFRQEQTNGTYKGHRDKDSAKAVFESHPLIHDITESLGCKNIYPYMMEADDVISWLCNKLDNNIVITTDTDMLQLVSEKTSIYFPMKKSTVTINNFYDKIGIEHKYYITYKAIIGDTADNIRGVNGYGKVKAKALAKLWVDDNKSIQDDYNKIITHNLKLMDLSIGYKIAGEIEEQTYIKQFDQLNNITFNLELFKDLCKLHNLNKILYTLTEWVNVFQLNHLFSVFNAM